MRKEKLDPNLLPEFHEDHHSKEGEETIDHTSLPSGERHLVSHDPEAVRSAWQEAESTKSILGKRVAALRTKRIELQALIDSTTAKAEKLTRGTQRKTAEENIKRKEELSVLDQEIASTEREYAEALHTFHEIDEILLELDPEEPKPTPNPDLEEGHLVEPKKE